MQRHVPESHGIEDSRLVLIPFVDTASQGPRFVIEVLLDASIDINTHCTHNSSTTLHYAAREGHHRIVAALLHMGVDKDTLDAAGQTPLIVAASRGLLPVVKTLLNADAGVHLPHTNDKNYHSSPLRCHWRNDGTVAALLDGGADMNASALPAKPHSFW